MSNEGIRYFYNLMQFPTDSWKIFYDFQPSGSVIPSLSGADSIYQGIPSLPTTGTFSGQHVVVSGSNNLNASNWGMMFVFEKAPNTYGTLFSNYHGLDIVSGFTIGVTSTNHLFVESWNGIEPIFYESNTDLATRNAVFVSKLSDRLELSYFNFNSKIVETESFFIPPSSFTPSNDWYIGNAILPPTYFSGQPFRGQIDKFLYLTGAIFPPQKSALFSGLTLSKAPQLFRGLLEENSAYSYVNLTGKISDITFDIINSAIYYVQTGYLFNSTGILEGKVSGIVNDGFGSGSGYISGYLTEPSGYLVYDTGFISGLSGYSTIGNGLRVFESNISSGVDNYFVEFPSPFDTEPVIFTELIDNETLLGHKISGVSNSGFTISLTSPTNSSNYILSTMAAPTQTDTDLKFFKTAIPINSDSHYINFPYSTISAPNLFCGIENNSEQMLPYRIGEISNTGFRVIFSNRVEFPDVTLHTLSTNLQVEDSFRIFQTGLISGLNKQFIPLSPAFAQTPIIFGELLGSLNDPILVHHISGLTNTGFYAVFSNNIPSTGYKFNTLGWSGGQNKVSYALVSGKERILLGQITDEAKNIYDLSGYENTMLTTQYDVPLLKSIYFTGVTGSIYAETAYITHPIYETVSYNLVMGTGEYANFTHTIQYQNDGDNFIKANHILNYSGVNVQPDPFTVFKTSYQAFEYKLEDFSYDTGYIYGFGMDGVQYISELDLTEVSELYVFPYSHNKTNLNLDASYDRSIQEFFLNQNYQNTDVNLYLNGMSLYGAGYRVTNHNPYTIELDADYMMSGRYAFMHQFGEETDRIVWDSISRNRRYRDVPQNYRNVSGVAYLDSLDISTYGLYLNGVKLLSGEDYITSGNTVVITDTEINTISGKMFILPLDSDIQIRYTGASDSIQTSRFARDTSLLWSDGIRQNLDEQYIEISNVGLLTSARSIPTTSSNIFDNETLFWQ